MQFWVDLHEMKYVFTTKRRVFPPPTVRANSSGCQVSQYIDSGTQLRNLTYSRERSTSWILQLSIWMALQVWPLLGASPTLLQHAVLEAAARQTGRFGRSEESKHDGAWTSEGGADLCSVMSPPTTLPKPAGGGGAHRNVPNKIYTHCVNEFIHLHCSPCPHPHPIVLVIVTLPQPLTPSPHICPCHLIVYV